MAGIPTLHFFEDAGGAPSSVDDVVSPAEKVAAAVAQCDVTGLGYVSCPVAPWSDKPVIGRVTTWPKEVEEGSRSIQVNCFMHASRRSPPTQIWDVSKEMMFTWLLQGVPVDKANAAERRRLGRIHMADFDACIARGVPAPRGTGAASSDDPVPR